MWTEFFLSFLLGAALLVVPGAAVCRGARLPWAFALAVAPGCSVALYSLIALGFSLTGVTLSGAVLLTVAVAAPLRTPRLGVGSLCGSGAVSYPPHPRSPPG